MSEPVKRSYDSSRRQEQARLTQRAILAAAHDLFVDRGYGRTTIGDIARAAGVSPETIYATFKNKATVLHRTWDVTIGGDDEQVVLHERAEFTAMRAEPDLARRLRMYARHFTATARRITPLVLAVQAAAGSEAVAADMLAEMGRQRYAGMGVLASEAAATGQLAVPEEECRDLMWAWTDGTLWYRLVVQRGWSDERFAEWLASTWTATLVRPAGG